MSLQPNIIINGQDDVASRKALKNQIKERVEASLDEYGMLWNATKAVARGAVKVAKAGANLVKGDDKEDEGGGGSSDFDEKEHPRGEDGKFVEAPRASGKGGLLDLQPLRNYQEVETKKRELYKAEKTKWDDEKSTWDAGEISRANKQIKKIQDSGEYKKANSELAKARAYLKKEGLSDDEYEKGTKNFQKANRKVRELKAKIAKIKPSPYSVPPPADPDAKKSDKKSKK